MHKLSHILAACAAGTLAIIGLAGTVRAETIISNGYLPGDASWTAADSPYILEDTVTVPFGRSLTIGPGVSIMADPVIEGYPAFDVQGNMSLNGEATARIVLSGSGGIRVQGGSTTISYADIALSDGLAVYNGYAAVDRSAISGAHEGIHVQKSTVKVTDSRLANNGYGVSVDRMPGPILQVRGDDTLFGRGGIGNALAQSTVAPAASSVTVSGSAIVNNIQAAIRNDDTQTIEATDNWWGTDQGPLATSTNSVIGPVAYAPWRTSDPDAVSVPICCSSILFIPGLEGTRLYKPQSFPVSLAFPTNRLWEPNRNADVTKLYLDATGSSTDASIYSGSPIGAAFGLKDVYGKFMSFLDGLAAKGTIGEWKAFGYDWRKPIGGVVAGAEKKATTTESLVQTVVDLASRSKTGKVSIVAHSNGGLVAKYLVKTLADMGRASLIDTVISVAVPYLGTPEAIAGLLHGDDQAIMGGLVTTAAVARGLGRNMASAYSLLPSTAYFSKILTPTIVFASTTDRRINDGSYPPEIGAHADQTAFILDSLSKRIGAAFKDLRLPIEGNPALMAAADAIHGVIDPFSWPAAIARYAIVGWNELQGGTTRQVLYTADGHTDVKTAMGDGTVVAQSAAHDAGTVASADLAALSAQEHGRIEHADILGASATQTAIAGMVTHAPSSGTFPLPPGMSWGEPDYSKPEPSVFTISTHSPVELHVYDSQGRHTGIIPQPAGLDEELEPGFLTFHEENIPGSGFEIHGDGTDPETFIRLPDTGERYAVKIRGIGTGTFTYEVQRERGSMVHENTILGYAEYSGIPVTPHTVATTTLQFAPVGLDATTTPGFVSLTQPLNVDLDGDGAPDFQATSTAEQPDSHDAGRRCGRAVSIKTALAKKHMKGKDMEKQLDKIIDICRSRDTEDPEDD